MKVYKEKQFLVFDFEDGKTVKYDFATKKSIGKSGKEVNNLCSQLRGLTIDEMCDNCTDAQYGKFLRYVQKNGAHGNREINNIGTILDRVPRFAHYEQLFSAGIEDIVDKNFRYKINDIPKGLIKLCREHSIRLSNEVLEGYKDNPDAFNLAYDLEFISLTERDIYDVLTHTHNIKIQNSTMYWDYHWKKTSTLNYLIKECGFTAKALFTYIDYLKTYEAIEDIVYMFRELLDYVNMMKEISLKFDKYPRNLLTTHRIASRNYNRLKQKFAEEQFQKRIDKSLEKTFGEYKFIYPDSTQDIKDEAVSQNNCVASYIQRVIDGGCHIMFLRKKDSPDKSLVTIEIRNDKIVQALQKYNTPLTKEQSEVVERWNKWRENKLKEKENESEELKYVS